MLFFTFIKGGGHPPEFILKIQFILTCKIQNCLPNKIYLILITLVRMEHSSEFSEDYPNKPPVVKFLSKMFHPNIYADGGICLDILQNRWSPTYDVSAILTSIQSLVGGSDI